MAWDAVCVTGPFHVIGDKAVKSAFWVSDTIPDEVSCIIFKS